MPDFANPFSGMVPDRKMTLAELTRAIRLDIAGEEEAIHLYQSHADATDSALAAAVLRDIADEERVHVGELQKLLTILLADEAGFLAEGAEEVEAMAAGAAEAAPEEPGADDIRTIGALR